MGLKIMNNTIIDMHNCITADELEKIVRHQLKLIFDKPEMAEHLPPLMIWGAPGAGQIHHYPHRCRRYGHRFY